MNIKEEIEFIEFLIKSVNDIEYNSYLDDALVRLRKLKNKIENEK